MQKKALLWYKVADRFVSFYTKAFERRTTATKGEKQESVLLLGKLFDNRDLFWIMQSRL